MSDKPLSCTRDDAVSGGFLLFIGAGAMAMAIAKYPLGSASQMGPGYVPALLGGLLALLGLLIALRGALSRNWKEDKFRSAARPLFFIIGVIILFGYVISLAGVIVSSALAIAGAALGTRETRMKEIIILAVIMAGLSDIFFVKILAMPFKEWPL
ncbi:MULTISPECIES: tripartite tricarboxylate transporter TctB family protein [unclassified Brenneria]|uniref:tripartite tricarboxylate transporter TctB family protein n=1 Tax=unclassified Brenneria TaxID=2634434 RepID=UPI0029C33976|nr:MULTISPECIES: tripartite tricarboxylate transporter TctB family protein [unclassified Brenneria]MDX5630858.1 tripartite tricarboxylate transporter TctB family protein [Brenneria sp. L3-3Z]MDX5697940.1 tripartite tricarboxylate transporter TctB family protein [Brenneria sp. L4-2C]